MVGHGGSSAGSYLADPTSPIPSHCASIVVTSTLRVISLYSSIIQSIANEWCFFSQQEALAAAQSPNKVWRSLDLEPHQRPPFKTQRSSSMPTPKTQRSSLDCGAAGVMGDGAGKGSHSPVGPCAEIKERSSRGSVSNESNILLDPDVLLDYPTQALLLTVLVSITYSIFEYTVIKMCRDLLLPNVVIKIFSTVGLSCTGSLAYCSCRYIFHIHISQICFGITW